MYFLMAILFWMQIFTLLRNVRPDSNFKIIRLSPYRMSYNGVL